MLEVDQEVNLVQRPSEATISAKVDQCHSVRLCSKLSVVSRSPVS